MSAPIVVFDLDGTLVDTAPDLVDTLNLMLTRHGLAPVPFAQARDMIGGGVRVLLERGLQARDAPVAAEELDRMFMQFLEHYSAHIADRSRPFPGVEAALDRLAKNGCILAVCTNKYEALSIKLLDVLGLKERFAAICGQDTFGVKKPDPEVLQLTIAKARGDLRSAVMVGDSATDVDLARAAGVPVVAVDFGYTERPVATLGADRVIGHFDALPEIALALLRNTATHSPDAATSIDT